MYVDFLYMYKIYILSANILPLQVETLIFIYYITVFHKTDYTKNSLPASIILQTMESHYYYKLTIKNFKEVKSFSFSDRITSDWKITRQSSIILSHWSAV